MAIAELRRADDAVAPEHPTQPRHRSFGGVLLAGTSIAALAGLVWRRTEMIDAARTIRDVDPLSIVAATVLLMLGLINRGALHRTAHRTLDMDVALGSMTRLGAAVAAVNKVVRSGGAVGIALFVGDGQRHGRPAERVVIAYLLSSLASQLALALLLGPAVLIAHRSGQISNIWLAAGIGALIYMGFLLAAAFGASRSSRLLGRLNAIARRADRSNRDAASHLQRADDQLDLAGLIRNQPAQIGRLLLHAIIDKAVGLATLSVTLVGLGANFEPDVALVSYCVALVSSMIALVPAGIGAVEVSLGAALAAASIPSPVVNSGVLAFRFFDLWMPVLIGIPTLRSLNRRRQVTTQPTLLPLPIAPQPVPSPLPEPQVA